MSFVSSPSLSFFHLRFPILFFSSSSSSSFYSRHVVLVPLGSFSSSRDHGRLKRIHVVIVKRREAFNLHSRAVNPSGATILFSSSSFVFPSPPFSRSRSALNENVVHDKSNPPINLKQNSLWIVFYNLLRFLSQISLWHEVYIIVFLSWKSLVDDNRDLYNFY